MPDSFSTHLVALGQRELSIRLARLCDTVGAEESSILVPDDPGRLVFFASTNPTLAREGIPPVPVVASFTGLVFSTAQAIAVADAAGQTGHFKDVDNLLARPTRAFAAVPMLDRHGAVLAVLTLANRRPPPFPRAGESFSPGDLAEAGKVADDLAEGLALLRRLVTERSEEGTTELEGLLATLAPRDRRAVDALVAALVAEGRRDDAVI
jgi:GAF domain-containing protein